MAEDRIYGISGSQATKLPCRVATTSNITLSGTQTIDGVAVVADDRVLVKDQATGSQNGIYIVSADAWTRAPDFDGVRDVVSGTLVGVVSGTLGSGALYSLTTTGTIVPGTTSMTFSQRYLTTAEALAAQAAAEAAQTLAETAVTNAQTAETNAETAQGLAEAAAAAAAASAVAAVASTSSTSTSSLAIAVASKTFVTQSGKAYTPGLPLVITSGAAPTVDWMYGLVTSYSGTSLVVDVQVVGGSGTHADWTITLSGVRGPQGVPGGGGGDMLKADNLTGMASSATSRSNIGAASLAANTFTGAQTLPAEVSVASGTPDIGAADSNNIFITGTTAITALGTVAAGTTRTCRLQGALTLTHHATSLILPGGANITTAAGDCFEAESLGAGNWVVRSYTKASGNPVKEPSTVSIGLGLHTIWVPAAAMIARTTSGAAVGATESATNNVMIRTMDFDGTAAEYAQFSIRMPKSWDEGTVTAIFDWSNASGTGDVIWGIQGLALSNDDAIDTAFGTAQTVTDSVTAAGDLMKSAATSAMTIGGTPAAEDLVVFQVYRDSAAGGDTLNAIDARLHGVTLLYTIAGATDA